MTEYRHKKGRLRRGLLSGAAFFVLGFGGLAVGYNDAHANPSGGQVVAGQATITQNGITTTIQQQSQRAVIEWQNFSIDKGELTQFLQNNPDAAILNKVVSSLPSHIYGDLTANGRVFLVNPNGVVIGHGARVDTRSFLATTLNIAAGNFMEGQDLHFQGNSASAIVNLGEIHAGHGDVFLIARQVKNEGTITAPKGEAGLIAAADVYLSTEGPDGSRITVKANDFASDMGDLIGVDNKGLIEAARVKLAAMDGQIYDMAINNSGTIRAMGLESGHDGALRLVATGAGSKVENSGTLFARKSDGRGGNVDIFGDRVTLRAGSMIDVRGTGQTETQITEARSDNRGFSGGGRIRVGGDYQGTGESPTSTHTVVENGAVLRADAIDHGDGGKVIVWADETTRFSGEITARGGSQSGNGGFVETSGKEKLRVTADAFVDASSEVGGVGAWLLDPHNVSLEQGAGGGDFIADSDDEVVNIATIEAALDGGTSVTITTGTTGTQDGDITVRDTVNKGAGGEATLTLRAARHIIFDDTNAGEAAGIISTAGVLNVVLNADADSDLAGAVSLDTATITTNGGFLVIGGGSALVDTDGNGILGDGGFGPDMIAAYGAGALSIGVDIQGTAISTGAGDVVITGRGLDGAVASNQYGVNIENPGATPSTITTTTGNIKITGVGGAGIDSNEGIRITGTNSTVETNTGTIDLTGTGASSGDPLAGENYGINIEAGGSVNSQAAGGGAVTLTGVAGAGGDDNNIGIRINGAGSEVRSVDGNITIVGTGNGTGGGSIGNIGVEVSDSGQVISTGTGAGAATIAITGTGAIDGEGVFMDNGGTVTSAEGDITITATGATQDDLNLNDTPVLTATAAATDITLNIDTLTTGGTNPTITATGDIFIRPRTAGIAINLGGAAPAGGLEIDNTQLAFFAATGTLNIGDPTNGTGLVTIDTLDLATVSALDIDGGSILAQNLTNIAGNVPLLTARTGNLTFVEDDTPTGVGAAILADVKTNFQALQGDLILAPETNTDDIGIAGGAGVYAFALADMQGFTQIGGNLIIGDPNGGSGDINVNAFDTGALDYGVGFQGGTFNLDGNVISARDFLAGADTFNLNANTITAGQDIILEPQTASRSVAVGTSTLGDTVISNAMITQLNVGERYNLIIGDQVSGSGTITAEGIDLTRQDHGIGLFGGVVDVRSDLISDGDILLGADSINVETFFDENPFNLTAGVFGDVLIRPMSDATTIDIDGDTGFIQFGGVDQLAFSQIGMTDGQDNTLTIGKAGTGTGAVTIDTLDMSARDHNLEIYGGSATITNGLGAGFGLNMSARDFILHAQGGGDILVEADIQRDNAETAKFELRADENITFNNNGNVTATTGALNVLVNSDADGDQSGRVEINSVVHTTNGGHYVIGGGSTPGGTAAYGNAGGTAGVLINTASIITGTGDLYITGHAFDDGTADDLVGVNVTTTSILSTTTGNMRVIGTGGAGGDRNYGVSLNQATVSSITGMMEIIGTGGTDGTDASTDNLGVSIAGGTVIRSFGTTSGSSTNIDVTGTGGAGGVNNWGVGISGTGTQLTAVAGDINVTGTGGSNNSIASTDNYGVSITAEADISSTGTAADAGGVNLIGTAGNGMTDNLGLRIDGTNTTITTVDGDMVLTGTGGSNRQVGSDDNYGVLIANEANVSSTGTTVADAGTISITGTGGAGADGNRGVQIEDVNTLVTSVAGAISVTGTGGSHGEDDSDQNHGVVIADRAAVTSTGTGADAATITIAGTTASGDEDAIGVLIDGDGTAADYVATVDGDVSITGTARTFDSTASTNRGFVINNAARVNSTGDTADGGAITIVGTGADGEDTNIGVSITGALTRVQSDQGNITITGTGGSNGSTSSNGNDGILLNGTASVRSIGTGATASTITMTGVAGDGLNENRGVHIVTNTTSINTVDGDVSITGTGGSSGDANADDNDGIFIDDAQIVSTGTGVDAGSLTFNGTGGDSEDDNEGFRITGVNSSIQTQEGNISITGEGQGSGTGNNGIEIDGAIVRTNAGTADLSFIADETIFSGGPTVSATNDIFLRPTDTTIDINIGDAAFGAGYNLDETYLAQFVGNVGNRLVIGDTVAGAHSVTIDTLDLANVPTLQAAGADVTVQNLSNIAGNVPIINAITGDLRFEEADVPTGVGEVILADIQTNFTTTAGDLYLLPENDASTVGLAGGAGTYNFSEVELAGFAQIGGNLIIGDKENASGAVNMNAIDLGTAGATYGLGVFGGSITLAGNVETAGDLLLGADTFTAAAFTLTAADDLLLQPINDATNIDIDEAGDAIDFGAVLQIPLTQLDAGNNLILGDSDDGAGTVSIANALDLVAESFGLELYGDTLSTGVGDTVITGGDLVLGFDDFAVSDVLQPAVAGDMTIRPMTASAAIAINGAADTLDFGGAGNSISFTNITVSGNGRLFTIGDADNGTGSVSVINNWDVANYSNIRLVGGDVTVTGLVNGDNTSYTFEGRTGDVDIQNINVTANTADNHFLNIFAADDISVDSFNMNALAGTGRYDVLLNADRDGDQNGSIIVQDSSFQNNSAGGYFVAGGGSGTLDSDGNSIFGDAGNGPDVTAAYGDATQEEGVIIDNTSISSISQAITIIGKAHDAAATDDLVGVLFRNDASVSSANGNILVQGTGGAGRDRNYGIHVLGDDPVAATTAISSNQGDVVITGIGGSDGTSTNTDNFGVLVELGADITSIGTGGGAANITITGTAGLGDSGNIGVMVRNQGTELRGTDGDITIIGTGTTTGVAGSTGAHGIVIRDEAVVNTLGAGNNAGTVAMTGTGGAGEDDNYGILIENNNTIVRVNAGAMNLVGQGGTNGSITSDNSYGVYIHDQALAESQSSGSNAKDMDITGTGGAAMDHNYGVFIEGNGTLVTTDAADMNITGTGGTLGTNESDHNFGVRLFDQASVTSTGNGNITITGTGGAAYEFNRGVEVDGNGVGLTLETDNGDLTLDGTGGTNGAVGSNENQGVYLSNNVTMTGNGVTNGGLVIVGRGAAAESENHGVELADATVVMTADGGNIQITGFGGTDGSVDSNGNVGVLINAADISSTGVTFADASDIIITGTGAAGQDQNDGVVLQNNASITSVAGDITVTGTGGTNRDGASDDNRGIAITDVTIDSTGNAGEAGRITLVGTGADAQTGNHGIDLGLNAIIRSDEGNIDITAIGGTLGHVGSDENHGLYMHDGADILSVGAGAAAATVTADTTAAPGDSDNYAFYMDGTGTTISSAEGAIDVTTTVESYGTRNEGVYIDAATVETTGGVISAVFNTNAMRLENSPTLSFTQDVSVIPTAATTSIGVAGGAGVLDLTATEVGYFTATGSLNIGDGASGTGAVTVSDLDYSANNFATLSLLGGSITATNLVHGAKNIVINALDGSATLVQDTVALTPGSSIAATENIVFQPETPSRTIGLAGGAGDLNIDDAEIALLTIGDTLILGDGVNGTGDAEIDVFDFSAETYDVQVFGGNILATDVTTGPNGILLNALTGDVTYSRSDVVLGNGSFLTALNDIIFAPQDPTSTIGISGGAGDFNIVDLELAFINPGRSLIIGDSVNGTGLVDIDSADFSGVDYNVEFHGGSIVIDDLVHGTNDLTLNARVSDVIFTENTIALTAGSSITAANDITIKPKTNGLTVGISGGEGLFNIDDSELAVLNPGNRLIIGNDTAAVGFTDIQSWDFSGTSYDVEVYGGEIRATDIDMGTNTTVLTARVGDITVTQDTIDITVGSNFTAARDIRLQPGSNSTTIGISGATGDFNISDDELALLNPTDSLIFGRQIGGVGNIRVAGLDYSARTFTLELYGGNTNIQDMVPGANPLIVNTNSGDITFAQDTVDFVIGSDISSANDVIFLPTFVTTSIGISGGAGTLNLSDDELGFITPRSGRIVFGAETFGNGAVDIDGWNFSTSLFDRVEIYGGNITASDLFSGSKDLIMAAQSGDITLTQDFAFFDGTANSITATNDITLIPETATTTIGLGNGTGALNLSDFEINIFDAGGRFTIGDRANGTGAIDIQNANVTESYVSVIGGDTTINSMDIDGQLELIANTGNITIDDDLESQATGDAIVLAALNGEFINNKTDSFGLYPRNGRFLVYAGSPTSSDTGKLPPISQLIFSQTFEDNPPSSFAGNTANLLLFRTSAQSFGEEQNVVADEQAVNLPLAQSQVIQVRLDSLKEFAYEGKKPVLDDMTGLPGTDFQSVLTTSPPRSKRFKPDESVKLGLLGRTCSLNDQNKVECMAQ